MINDFSYNEWYYDSKEAIMIRIISLLFIALFFTNCSTKRLSSVNVSDYFWIAEKNQDLDDAKKFVLPEDVDNVKLQKNIKIRRFTFAKAEENENHAIVPTTMHLEGILSKKKKDEIEIEFDTKLVKTDTGWKVDFYETKKGLYIETAKKFSTGLGSQIFSKIKEGLGDLKGLQGGFEEMIDGLKKSLEK